MAFNRFQGTDTYLVTPELRDAVNVAIALEKPLLIRGEPGTGKTVLAEAVSESLEMELIAWNIKSTSKAQDGLYVYDTVQRLNDARFGDSDINDIRKYIKLKSTSKAQDGLYVYDTVQRLNDARFGDSDINDIRKYIKQGSLGRSLTSTERVVLLIDEIDKADMEFPNDLLHELDRMSFAVAETGEQFTASERPIVIITSNNEKELPDAFLRRCVFHYIAFPDKNAMADIVRVHHPGVEDELLKQVLLRFYWLRDLPTLRKRPSTSELVDWIAALQRGGVSVEAIANQLPFLGVLLKRETDVEAAALSARN